MELLDAPLRSPFYGLQDVQTAVSHAVIWTILKPSTLFPSLPGVSLYSLLPELSVVWLCTPGAATSILGPKLGPTRIHVVLVIDNREDPQTLAVSAHRGGLIEGFEAGRSGNYVISI